MTQRITLTISVPSAITGLLVGIGSMLILGAATQTGGHSTTLATAQALRLLDAEHLEILGHMSIHSIDDGFGNPLKTLRIEGINVQIVSGLGATNGNPADPATLDSAQTAVNGLGNLIIGYNEHIGASIGVGRVGSHNLVVGSSQDYSYFGGLAAGFDNALIAPYASASGGSKNRVSGDCAAVSGGLENFATDTNASISGGEGGRANAPYSSISGGIDNRADEVHAWVGGGSNNVAGGPWAAVSGGSNNEATFIGTSVSGGNGNSATASGAWVGGGAGNVASGGSAAVSGGFVNRAEGLWSSVSGGQNHVAPGQLDWVAGTLFEDE